MKISNQKIKNKKGSVLVFSLIILFMSLSIALGISGTALISRKMSNTTGSSTQAFQVADSGAEIVLKKIKDMDGSKTLDEIPGMHCSDGIIADSIGSGREYKISFFKEDESQADCSTKLDEINKLKSSGSYANTVRAIEVAVAKDETVKGSWCGLSEYYSSKWITCKGKRPGQRAGEGCPDGYTLVAWGVSSGTFCSDLPGTNCSSSGSYYSCVFGDPV